jgi:hypothetical protein
LSWEGKDIVQLLGYWAEQLLEIILPELIFKVG